MHFLLVLLTQTDQSEDFIGLWTGEFEDLRGGLGESLFETGLEVGTDGVEGGPVEEEELGYYFGEVGDAENFLEGGEVGRGGECKCNLGGGFEGCHFG